MAHRLLAYGAPWDLITTPSEFPRHSYVVIKPLDETAVRDALAEGARNWWSNPVVEIHVDGFTLTARDGAQFVITIRRAGQTHE